MTWQIVFLLVILKIPIVYLCVVIWWAIRAEPAPPDPSEIAVVDDTPPAGGSPRRRRPGRRRPGRPHVPGHGGGVTSRQRGGART